jgi:GntR family transcriptional regulator, arabinose operon transcriptional repressor
MTEAVPTTHVVQRRGPLKYEQLKRTLLDQLSSGQLKPGDVLPPEVELAQQMGVARNTVRQAMRDLELQHVVRRVRGKGTIICEPTMGSVEETRAASELFGLVLPEIRTGMYQSLQAGMNSSMSGLGANMIVCDSGQDLYQQIDVLLQLAHRGVSGLALVPITTARTPVHHLAFLRQNRLPLVFCHRRVPGICAPLVGFSAFEIGAVAGRELARLGHRRLSVISSHFNESCEDRIRGVRAAMAEVGGAVPDEFVYFDTTVRADPLPPGLEDRLTAQLKKMLAEADPPTGIVASADCLAGVTCLVLQKLGVAVPGDMSVMGFGDCWNRNVIMPVKLKSVTVDEWRLGQIAFETLRQIRQGQRALDDQEDIWMPLELSDGESVGPSPG